jgi:hypothetical protein
LQVPHAIALEVEKEQFRAEMKRSCFESQNTVVSVRVVKTEETRNAYKSLSESMKERKNVEYS